jgi:hypothetical protein
MAITRQLLIDRLKVRMATITTGNGYYTSAGSNVSVWKTNPFSANKVEGIDIRDLDDPSETLAEDESLEQHFLKVELRLIAKTTATETADARLRKLEADAKKAISTDEYWSSGGVRLADKTLPKGTVIEVEQDSDRIAGAVVTIEIQYVTVKFLES